MNKSRALLIIIATIICAISFNSCDNFEGSQEIPAYIKIDGFKVVGNPNSSYEQGEGFLTSEISDVWVYVDNKFIGAYSFKGEGDSLVVPILAKGKHLIELEAGIKYNGMASTREAYKFYTSASDSINLVEGQTTEIPIKEIMYNSYATFSFLDFFEDSYLHFENCPSTDSTITSCFMSEISGDSVRYGNHCGAMYMNSGDKEYKVMTKDSITCSNTNAMIMELDYHCNIPFEVGIYGRTSSEANYQYISAMRLKANEKDGWQSNSKKGFQKVYIILGKVWGQLSYKTFHIYFNPKNPDKVNNGYVHIDNIKVIHYPESKGFIRK